MTIVLLISAFITILLLVFLMFRISSIILNQSEEHKMSKDILFALTNIVDKIHGLYVVQISQINNGKKIPFGKLAVREGFMTEAQVELIIQLQAEIAPEDII